MEKERKIKVISLVALIIAVLGLTVAFAAMSQQLTINGTATLDAASWDIHFENLQTLPGEGTSGGSPVIDGTSITGINAVITKPGDQVIYLVDIVNNGTINAKIESVEISKLCTLQSPVEACDWDNNGSVTQTDIDKVNDNISFIMGYEVGATILKKDDVLNKGQSKRILVQIVYAKFTAIDGSYANQGSIEEATELPKRDLKFNDLSIKINYVQAD